MADAYVYPTPATLEAYRGNVNALPGTATPLSINTSNLGAPAVGGPMTTANPGRAGPRLTMRQRIAILIFGADAGSVLFPPQQPLQPIAQPPQFGAVGRQWDYPVGWNTRVPPRSGLPVTFATLKGLADDYDVLRIMLERVKDKVNAQNWTIGMRDEKAARDPLCDEIQDLLTFPDKLHTWDDWLRMLLEQVLVYDAPAVWLRPDRKGDLYSLEILDGSLISPKIMPDGRLPPPEFGPAYQQVIKGLPAVDYIQPVPKGQLVPVDPTGEPFPELYYRPRNVRINSVYGFSPVEQIIKTINIGIAGEEFMLDYYRVGSTPDLLLGVPETWNPDQIANFQNWWDSVLSGNLANRRNGRFIPGGIKPIDTKEKAILDPAVNEWLVRVMCFCLGLNPMPFVKMMNRGQEQVHHEEALEEGLGPWLEWVSNFMNTLIALKFARRDIVFRWAEEDETDPKTQAEIHEILVKAKIYHPDEIRVQRGDQAMTPEMRAQMDMATFSNQSNSTVLPPDQQAEADQRHADAAEAAAALAPKPQTPQDKAKEQQAAKQELALLLKAFDRPPPTINVAAPQITLPPITMPAIQVDAPTINLPEIKLGDTFLDVGATNVKVDLPKTAGIGKTVTAERTKDGSFIGTITDGTSRKVHAARDAQGNLVAKVEAVLDANGKVVKAD